MCITGTFISNNLQETVILLHYIDACHINVIFLWTEFEGFCFISKHVQLSLKLSLFLKKFIAVSQQYSKTLIAFQASLKYYLIFMQQ